MQSIDRIKHAVQSRIDYFDRQLSRLATFIDRLYEAEPRPIVCGVLILGVERDTRPESVRAFGFESALLRRFGVPLSVQLKPGEVRELAWRPQRAVVVERVEGWNGAVISRVQVGHTLQGYDWHESGALFQGRFEVQPGIELVVEIKAPV